MKKNAIRILSLFLVVMTLVGAISLPVSAYSYPMNYTITYGHSEPIDQCGVHDGLYEIHTPHSRRTAGCQPNAGIRQNSTRWDACRQPFGGRV